MNRGQRIIIFVAVALLILLKLAIPPFRPTGSEGEEGVFGDWRNGGARTIPGGTVTVVATMGVVAASGVVLLIKFRDKK